MKKNAKNSKYTEIITEASTSAKELASAACASCAPRVTTVETAQTSAEASAAAEACPFHIGIDVGSTTVKLAVLDNDNEILWAVYRRHHADVRATIVEVLREAAAAYPDDAHDHRHHRIGRPASVPVARRRLSCRRSSRRRRRWRPSSRKTDVAIELGGEDAKIIYFDNGIEQRMNGTCAGGTGAFIDQMAALLDTDAGGLNELAADHDDHLPHREPLRRVRQDRRAAASERGRAQGGHRRLHLPVGGDPDHLRPRLRPAHPGARGLPRRPLAVPARTAQALLRNAWN